MEFLFALWLWQPMSAANGVVHYAWVQQAAVFETKQLCDGAAKELLTQRRVYNYDKKEWESIDNPHRCLPVAFKKK